MRVLINTPYVTLSVLTGLCILATTFPVLAAEQDSEEWDYFVVGYLFGVSIDATTAVGTPLGASEMDLDLSFSEILDHLDSAFTGIFAARKGRWSLNADVSSISLSIDDVAPSPTPANVDIELDVVEIELFAGYTFSQQYPNLEAIAGARYIDQDIDVDVIAGPAELNVDAGDDWIDPFIGLRYHGPINDEWSLLVRGDVGGFGVGSDFAWRFNAGFTSEFKQNWEFAIMVKVLDMDYENGSTSDLHYYKWDGTESGLLLGLGYHF